MVKRSILLGGVVLFIALSITFQNCSTEFKAISASSILLTQSQNGVSVSEPTSLQSLDLEFAVSLDKAQTQPVTIFYDTIADTAKEGVDFIAVSGKGVIAAGETSLKIKIPTLYYKVLAEEKFLKLDVTSTGPIQAKLQARGKIVPAAVPLKLKALEVGGALACGINLIDEVVCWGRDTYSINYSRAKILPTKIPGLSGVKTIAVGYYHACVITPAATVKCWGSNGRGQIGREVKDSTDIIIEPYEIPNLSDIKSIAVGEKHSCAVTGQGIVKCWGSNDWGQLGHSNYFGNFNEPMEVAGVTGAKTVNAGPFDTCAVTDKNVKCWGSGTREAVHDVSNSEDIISLSSDSSNNCGVTTSGMVKCWLTQKAFSNAELVEGFSDIRSLAVSSSICGVTLQNTLKCSGRRVLAPDGNFIDSKLPIAVDGLTNVKSFSQKYSSCALNLDQTVKCWGYSDIGYTAVGISILAVDIAPTEEVKDIVTGPYHSCALSALGKVKCWDKGLPVEIPELVGVKKLSVGSGFTCAITQQNTVKCWGQNDRRQLGNKTFEKSAAPVDVLGLTDVIAIASRESESCALTDQSKIKCWGDNLDLHDEVPETVDATAISMGSIYNCLLTGGKVRCWSSTTNLTEIPKTVGATALAMGENHSCAIVEQGMVKCWGSNDKGQLGTGIVGGYFSEPVTVDGIVGAKKIELGSKTSCAVLSDDKVKCWGENGFGIIGNNNITPALTPVEAFMGQAVKILSLGHDQSNFVSMGSTLRTAGSRTPMTTTPAILLMPNSL